MLTGVYTALITPFSPDGTIDINSFEKILENQKRAKVSGVVLCGTTGEAPTLEEDEKIDLVRFTQDFLRGSSLEVIVGTGSNSTQKTIELTQKMEKQGVKKFLLVTPYYNKPSQSGLLEHFKKIEKETSGELILYHIPGRTAVRLELPTLLELAECPRVVGIKEASGSISLVKKLVDSLSPSIQKKFSILSGDDSLFLPMLEEGAVGVVSVASHIVPHSLSQLYSFFCSGNKEGAKKIHEQLQPLFVALFIETNPAPLKWLLSQNGTVHNQLRLPLVPIEKANEKRILQEIGLSFKGWAEPDQAWTRGRS